MDDDDYCDACPADLCVRIVDMGDGAMGFLVEVAMCLECGRTERTNEGDPRRTAYCSDYERGQLGLTPLVQVSRYGPGGAGPVERPSPADLLAALGADPRIARGGAPERALASAYGRGQVDHCCRRVGCPYTAPDLSAAWELGYRAARDERAASDE